MGATENAELVRRGYEAFNAGDMETLTGLFDEDASWHTPGHASIAGDHVGRDAAFSYFGQLGEGTQGTFQAEVRSITADDEGRVVGVHHCSGERNGRQLDVDCALIFQVKDGKIVDGRDNFYDLYAWDEFWS